MKTWYFTGRVDRVIDGDTVDIFVDLGFRAWQKVRFRLLGINAPEPKMETREAGLAAAAYLGELLFADHDEVRLISTKSTDKYGRWLAEIWVGDDQQSINSKMVESGHAEVYEVK